MTAPHQTPVRLSSSRGERATGAQDPSLPASRTYRNHAEEIAAVLAERDAAERNDRDAFAAALDMPEQRG